MALRNYLGEAMVGEWRRYRVSLGYNFNKEHPDMLIAKAEKSEQLLRFRTHYSFPRVADQSYIADTDDSLEQFGPLSITFVSPNFQWPQ
jgi:hypothetical protein